MTVKFLDKTGLGYFLGKIKAWASATFASKSHSQASNTINAMTGYSKPSSGSAIAASDSLNSAIGKLEAKVDAVDDSNYVHLTGNETIVGTKTFSDTINGNAATASTASTIYDTLNIATKDTKPSVTTYDTIAFTTAQDGNTIADIYTGRQPDGSQVIALRVSNPSGSETADGAYLQLFTNYDGTDSWATCPTPTLNTNSNAIATTNWVRNATGNTTLTAANVSGTVAIAHGGTGSTTRTDAVNSLFNEGMTTSNSKHFLTVNDNFTNAGWLSVNNVKTVLGLKSAAYTNSTDYVHTAGNETISGTKTFNSRIHGTIEAPIHVTASSTLSSGVCNTVVAVCDDTPQWVSELYYCREASTNGTTVLRTWSKDHSAATYMAVYYDEANKVGYLAFDNLYKDVKLANPNFRRGGTRSSTEWWNIGFRGNNSNSDMGSMHQWVDANGQAELQIRCAFDNSTYSYKEYWIWTRKDGTSAAGVTADMFRPTMTTYALLGSAGEGRWGQLYSTSGTINTSDERLKCDISNIPDDILDAWESCEFYQYKMKDSVDKKGENARYHTGMIAQRLDIKFKNANKNLNKYGLFCYDEWEASEARKDDHGKITEPAVEAGNEYSIRYEEALCMEAAYQRRKNKILENRISELETQVQNMLQILESLKGA